MIRERNITFIVSIITMILLYMLEGIVREGKGITTTTYEAVITLIICNIIATTFSARTFFFQLKYDHETNLEDAIRETRKYANIACAIVIVIAFIYILREDISRLFETSTNNY